MAFKTVTCEVRWIASIGYSGNDWRLYQDGALWAYCEELMTDEEYENFFGREREVA